MKKLLLLASAMGLAATTAWADVNCTGIVVDEHGEPMIGVTVVPQGSDKGVPTDIDGKFKITVPDNVKNLELNFIGYEPMIVKAASAMGTIHLKPKENMLQDVIVTQSVARTRMTPVALSNVDAATIDIKLGNQELPEVLKTTPGVWATRDGGGYGDAKINMRGFKAANVAVLVNGVPVNDMEWGGVYWSNWTGLSDVTSSMQTQRGLGASILSAPSVGGTISIITRSLDAKKGGSIWYGLGNDGLNNIGASVSTGVMDNGWAVTLLGSKKWADGYIQGTQYEAWTYFVNVSKRINEEHQLSFTATGSPQWHNQRSTYDGLTIEGWQNVRNYMDNASPYRYNPTFGYDRHGQQKTAYHNQYHKPHISLTHTWQIDYKSSLTSSVYASIASGGGYSGQGRNGYSSSSWYGANTGILNTTFRCPDGTFDYAAIQEMNAASNTGSNMIMSESINAHEWFGLISNYKNNIIPGKLAITGGLDVRYYVGHHKNKIIDLYDGEYYIDDTNRSNVLVENNIAAADPNWVYEKLGVGDVIYRDYNGYTMQEGLYAQAEYFALDKRLTAILTGTVNNTTYWRRDFFYYDKEHEKSKTVNFWSGSIKGGVNYNIDRHNNVYFNTGYISRAPFFSGGAFLASTVSNATNPNAVNEKIYSFELGYGFHSPMFSATVDGYYTKWLDKTTTRTGTFQGGEKDGQRYSLNLEGVDARHMGIEVNATFQPCSWFSLDGMISLGDWIWDSNATGYFYGPNGEPIADITTGAEASGVMAADHLKGTINQKGIHVGGSAQWTGAVGVTFRPFKGWRIGADWTCNSHNYSDYTVSAPTAGGVVNVEEPWRIPWGNQLDLNASYRFKLGGMDATLYGNLNNLFNYNYVMDAYTASDTRGTWENAYRVFYSFGRTWSLRLKIQF
ncbi:MAG: TonB-dependent receptor [Bacteroidales bacterium]|nr:TonB-dependent receptor [Bacteroidales bacterium]